MRVILDAMGADRAPVPEVLGALAALKAFPELEVILVGDEAQIRKHLKTQPRGLRVVHAPQRVYPSDKPSAALREKRQSSMALAVRMLKDGEGDALISAGNTGALMAFSLMTLGRVAGVKRPGIGATFPRVKGGYTLVLDVGAAVDLKPFNLLQFAVMGSVAYRALFGVRSPRVALLSVGEEETKGSRLVQEAQKLLRESGLNYVGFVEGHELLTDKADVAVMDGFVGNALLKFGEGVVYALFSLAKAEIRKRPLALLGALLMKGALKSLLKKVDFEEHGGAPLLGVNGLVLVSHGRSSPRAIANAIRTARELYSRGFLQEVKREITRHL